MRSFRRSMSLDSDRRGDTGRPPGRLAGFDPDAASVPASLHGTARLRCKARLARRLTRHRGIGNRAVSSEPGGAVSSEPGPVREANGVRAPANRRPPATSDIPCCECRTRSRRRSRSEWGASVRESAPAGDTGHSMLRMAYKELAPFAKANGVRAPANQRPPATQGIQYQNSVQGAGANSLIAPCRLKRGQW
jgi:hypothetical protein